MHPQIDSLVGVQPEDIVVNKIRPNNGKQDVEAEAASNGGGTSKLPSPYKPYTISKG